MAFQENEVLRTRHAADFESATGIYGGRDAVAATPALVLVTALGACHVGLRDGLGGGKLDVAPEEESRGAQRTAPGSLTLPRWAAGPATTVGWWWPLSALRPRTVRRPSHKRA